MYRAEAWAKGDLPSDATTIINFLSRYPVWPDRRALIAAAENLMTPAAPPAGLDTLYANTAPITLNGFETYISYLFAAGRHGEATRLIQDRWVNGPLDPTNGDDLQFYQTYRGQLSADDVWARVDRLVWDGESRAARNLYPTIGHELTELAEARLALVRGDADAPTKLDRVSNRLHDDAGLKYARAYWRMERDDTTGAADILLGAGAEGQPDAWWKLRHIIIRRLLEARDYRLAYKIAAQHGIRADDRTAAAPFSTAEGMAGWLALRFLQDPERAIPHFQSMHDNVLTAMSKSRGAYWLGRAYEAMGDSARARDWYQQASVQHAFFYGQLAIAKLSVDPVLTLPPEPQIGSNARGAFMALPLPAIIQALTQQGDHDRAAKFLRALLPSLQARTEYLLAGELAKKINGAPQLEIETAKAANAKGFILYTVGYPTRTVSSNQPEAALTLGLIRQESQFQPDVESSAGAVGLMQLLPSSAKAVAKKHGLPYKNKRSLENPATNIALGRAYLNDRIEQFDGSYIAAIAAYNGGQGRVRDWLDTYGDPRLPTSQGGVDPVDWIELLPIYETRNYVQRVLENTQIYRTLLAGGSAPLRIVQDLRR